MRRHGFTRLELATVLAVVVILGAAVSSAFSRRIRPNRERLECQANLRRIALAIGQYC